MRFNAIFTRRKRIGRVELVDTALTIVLRAALDIVPCRSSRLSRSTSASGSPASGEERRERRTARADGVRHVAERPPAPERMLRPRLVDVVEQVVDLVGAVQELGRREDAELGRRDVAAGERVVGGVVVEHRRRVEQLLAALPAPGCTGCSRRSSMSSARIIAVQNSTGSRMRPYSRVDLARAARLRVEQDRARHRGQVAAHALAVVLEHGGDARDVPGRRRARHRLLDQLLRR